MGVGGWLGDGVEMVGRRSRDGWSLEDGWGMEWIWLGGGVEMVGGWSEDGRETE